MATQDDLKTPTIALVGFVGAILMFALIVLLQVVYYHIEYRLRQQRDYDQPPAELGNVVAQQQARLADHDIDKAMATVVSKLRSGVELQGDPEAPRPKPKEESDAKSKPKTED